MPIGVRVIRPLARFRLSKQSGESLRPLPWDVTGGATNGGPLGWLRLPCFRRGPARPGRPRARYPSPSSRLSCLNQGSRPHTPPSAEGIRQGSGAPSDTGVPPPYVTSATLPPRCLVGSRPGSPGDDHGGGCGRSQLHGRRAAAAPWAAVPGVSPSHPGAGGAFGPDWGPTGSRADGQACGEARGRSPPTQIRWGLPHSQLQRKPRESGWNPRKKKILSSSDRASRTTCAASVQATAYGREGLGEQTYGKSLVQPGLDPEHLRNSLLLSFSPPLETQKLSPREMVLLPRIISWTRSPLGELKAPGFPVVCSPQPKLAWPKIISKTSKKNVISFIQIDEICARVLCDTLCFPCVFFFP